MELEKIHTTLRRLITLRDNPGAFAGEKANADAMISRICTKYGITEDSLFTDVPVERHFLYRNIKEKHLIMQICAHLFGSERYSQLTMWRYRNVKKFSIELNNSDYIALSEYASHYIAQYRLQQKRFLSAFIQGNDLTSDGPGKVPTPEDLEILKMARGMKTPLPRKQIEAHHG